jgi:hypothetical protein
VEQRIILSEKNAPEEPYNTGRKTFLKDFNRCIEERRGDGEKNSHAVIGNFYC